MMAQLRLGAMGGAARCGICHRPLSDPESVRRGVGPICGGRYVAGEVGQHEDATDGYLAEPLRDGIIVMRQPDGQVLTNVPRLVTEHSPSGYEFGYGGSGPADLALNILENVLWNEGHRGPRQQCWKGECFELAYRLHQDFKFQWIGGLDRQRGGSFSYGDVVAWIEGHRAEEG